MCYLKQRVTILLYLVNIIDSEQWYSATVSMDLITDFDTEGLNSSKESPVKHYLPLSVSKHENKTFNKPKWHFSQHHGIDQNEQSNTKSDAAEILRETAFTRVTAYHTHDSFENVDVLENLNKTSPTRPERKVLKRCPSVQPRRKKQRNENQTRKGKFLEVFEIMQFEHMACTSTSGLEGTCLHEYECQSAGGSTMGSCADGYATCCVILEKSNPKTMRMLFLNVMRRFSEAKRKRGRLLVVDNSAVLYMQTIQFVCDGRYSTPMGWLTNPDYPTPSTERIFCTIILDKSSADIQQIRLDFLIFEMLSPISGTCEDDQFIVLGHNTNNVVPSLCGINTGQHIYVEVGDADGPILFSIQTVSPEKRLYAIKITQLSKSDKLAAPKGCLQYFKDENGYLESFNYRDNSDISIPRYPSYLNNLNYAMCIERSATTCSVTYTNAGELQIPNYDTDGLPVIPPRQAGVEIFNCPSDWLLISAIRLCGERLNDGSVLEDFSLDAPVTDNGAGPLVIWFRSDGGYVGRGFRLYYVQNTCLVT